MNNRDKHLRSPWVLAVEGGWDIIMSQILQYLAVQDEIVDSMDYGDLRNSPLLMVLVNRPERKAPILNALVVADEKAFCKLPVER